MDVLVTGGEGLLGRTIARVCAARGVDVVAPARAELDVTDRDAVIDVVTAGRPALVVHCAAMTDVDACEADPGRAHLVNADGAGWVAEAAAKAGAGIVAVSTDYVFDGEKGSPYTEDDPTNPIQIYGRTKLAGEERVREATERHWIVRSAWIYGPGGKNFLSKLPDLARSGAPLKAVVDQIGTPTYAPDLAEGILRLTEGASYGTYHVVNPGSCSFAEFCRFAVGESGAGLELTEVTRADLGRPAPRPANTSLAADAWRRAGLPPLRPWTEAARAFLAEV